MRLSDFSDERRIAIQCHDNPDADALASGFGLFCFFESRGLEEVRFFYGGAAITKPNLIRMIDRLGIPAQNDRDIKKWDGLLISVDCQHGAGNVTRVDASRVAVIDHHIQEGELPFDHELRPWLGSCSTLVWHMLVQESFPIDTRLGTALHYGLFSDTNGFSEVMHPLDRDMWDSLETDKDLLKRLKRSNLSFADIGVASAALSGLYRDAGLGFVVISAPPCDPNLLGFIIDMAMQVDGVDAAVAYTPSMDGIKYSVRTAVRDFHASELASWLARGIGSGGGHREKAGGRIALGRFAECFGDMGIFDYITNSVRDYVTGFKVVDCAVLDGDTRAELCAGDMKTFRKLPVRVGFVPCHMLFEGNADLRIRMLEGDMDITADEETILMIGVKGEVYPIELEKFIAAYTVTGEKFTPDLMYNPTVLNKNTGERISIISRAHICVGHEGGRVEAARLGGRVKVFTRWDPENYLRGDPGDWLVSRSADDYYVIAGDVFDKIYILDCTDEDLSKRADAVRAVKKNIPVSVRFAHKPGVVRTLEGDVSFEEKDALISGTQEEPWPVQREKFFETYSPCDGTEYGDDGFYMKKELPGLALRMDCPFCVSLSGQRGVLFGKRGDWLMQYSPGEHGIIDREIFESAFVVR
ncbi:MAG: DHH family phosphoesterase [Synergistaceae bacterium]|jgi:phosphoglycolate phosphatase|nr:DHH family phosphoesterase [Synergistaceae bacterium]